ncbi:sulfite exporter TauE/SafE family protein [candidate division KSB1 bacterium]|nr:sulfite exporter TauE/SafE family protein [candidate division KSB1 bacterium]
MELNIIYVTSAVFLLGCIMSMLGRGGGNFYVPLLLASGFSMTAAAANAQLILMTTALLATVVFQKYKTVDWKLALVLDPATDIMAFLGGYFAHHFMSVYLKCLFALLLMISAFFMLKPIRQKKRDTRQKAGYWSRSFGQYQYQVNLWLAIPMTAAIGFLAGMLGISGGSFKIPLMVLMCGVPMHVAVGTSSAMVAFTALMGFSGHALAGDFQAKWILPLVSAAALGGLLGGKISIKVPPQRLKMLFVFTTILATFFMAANAFLL